MSTDTQPAKGDLCVWHIPQVPGKAFRVHVHDVTEAKKLLVVLADYDVFQYNNQIKPDYANASGLEIYTSEIYGPEIDDGWQEWGDPETGDDIWDLIRRERE
jgi:hypothetical protein